MFLFIYGDKGTGNTNTECSSKINFVLNLINNYIISNFFFFKIYKTNDRVLLAVHLYNNSTTFNFDLT